MALDNLSPGLTQHQKEAAYSEFVAGLKRYVGSESGVVMARKYQELEDQYVKDGGSRPKDMYEVGALLSDKPMYKFDRFLTRISQEMMWQCAFDTVELTRDEIQEWFDHPTQEFSTLELDPDLEYPNYFKNVEIHIMPGGYHSNPMMGPVHQIGSDIYALQTQRATRGYQQDFTDTFKELNPKRILDLGTGIGKSITPFHQAFPEAEIWAVELSRDFLRWAHYKAEHKKQRIHFSQQNTEKLSFEDESFDLVVADILFHELPPQARENTIDEAYRVLCKGGQFVIADIEPEWEHTPYRRFITEFQRTDNGEPFWSTHLATDYVKMMKEAGFSEARDFGLRDVGGGRRFPWVRLGTK